jgi:hypothetical protein
VVIAQPVEHARLLPDRGGQGWPTELLRAASRIDGGEKCDVIKALR